MLAEEDGISQHPWFAGGRVMIIPWRTCVEAKICCIWELNRTISGCRERGPDGSKKQTSGRETIGGRSRLLRKQSISPHRFFFLLSFALLVSPSSDPSPEISAQCHQQRPESLMKIIAAWIGLCLGGSIFSRRMNLSSCPRALSIKTFPESRCSMRLITATHPNQAPAQHEISKRNATYRPFARSTAPLLITTSRVSPSLIISMSGRVR